MSLCRIIYGKACYLPLELENKTYWVIKQLIMDMIATAEQKKFQLWETEELRLFSYENARLYKEVTKQIQLRELIPRHQVLLYNSRLKSFLEKLNSRWLGPFKLIKIYPHGAVKLQDERKGHKFKVNRQRVKHYIRATVNNPKEDLFLKYPA